MHGADECLFGFALLWVLGALATYFLNRSLIQHVNIPEPQDMQPLAKAICQVICSRAWSLTQRTLVAAKRLD